MSEPKSDKEWRKKLTPEQYHICREKGTEAPFTGKYNDCKEDGMYQCTCCGVDLFDSKAKFDSGSGWPSFYQAASQDSVGIEKDDSLGMARAEIICKNCGAHLGHVFEDGPQPTGQRFCTNSASLQLKPRPKH